MEAILTAALLGLTFSVLAQDSSPQPDRWRGLVLDESTLADAIRVLGKPASEKPSALPVQRINNWITKRRKEKVFQKLTFKKPEGVDGAELYFLDGKLVMIQIDTKNLSPNSLAGTYGIPFRPIFDAMDEALHPREFDRHEGRAYPKSYPTVYYAVATAPRSFAVAMVDNSSFGSVLKKSAGVGDAEGDMPGKIKFLQLISRTLENRDGADQLR